MNPDQMEKEITIMKRMVEKSRRETAESGHFFIIIGILGILTVGGVHILEKRGWNHLVLPALFVMLALNGLIGFLTTGRGAKDKVRFYPKVIYINIWFACATSGILMLFLFPVLKVYDWSLVPSLVSMVMGIAVFSTGVVFESLPIKGCSAAWWGGGVAMAFLSDMPRMIVMMSAILLGWILPGLILNLKYRKGRVHDET